MPKKATKKLIQQIQMERVTASTDLEVARRLGVSHHTVAKYTRIDPKSREEFEQLCKEFKQRFVLRAQELVEDYLEKAHSKSDRASAYQLNTMACQLIDKRDRYLGDDRTSMLVQLSSLPIKGIDPERLAALVRPEPKDVTPPEGN